MILQLNQHLSKKLDIINFMKWGLFAGLLYQAALVLAKYIY